MTQKSVSQKQKVKFENYKNCLEPTQLGNKIKQQKKINLTQIVLRTCKQLIRNNKSVLNTQQSFKSERNNVFTEEINQIVFRSNDDKRMQLVQQRRMHME